MQILKSVKEMQEHALELRREGKRVAFVPTMGYLHAGHESLIEEAARRGDSVVVSIFVNPTQFGPSEDFRTYPRDLDHDLAVCERNGVDVAFVPAADEMYPSDYSTFVEEERLSAGMCGVSRPSMFRGVCTVLVQLFNIVFPDVAIFGQKDAQQVAVVRKMVRDLHFKVEVVASPTMREQDGLAMSSRNSYLNEFERGDAAQIYQALLKGKAVPDSGQLSADRVLAEIMHHLRQYRRLRVIYVHVVDKDTLEPLREVKPGKTLVATAVWCDEVRLIDNIEL